MAKVPTVPKAPTSPEKSETLATANDIKRMFGALDEAKLLDILTLRPTVIDIEEASLWLAADTDIFGAGRPLKALPGEIVAILTADEEEEPRAAG